MKKTLRIAFATISICFVLLLVKSANAQATYPEGSYKLTCQNLSIQGNVLMALCKPKSGSINAVPYTKLYDFFLCDGDISNNDSTLECNKNQNSPLMKKARTAVKTAYKTLFGRDFTESVNPWLREFFKSNKEASTFFYNGLQTGIVGQFMQKFLREPGQSKHRLTVINNAFADVYGKASTAKDVAFWNSEISNGKGFYGAVVDSETKKLNSNKINRRFMITSAYKKSLGRAALATELAYWESKPEVFKEIVEANRNFLYSSNGAKDLAETIERVIYNKTGAKPTTKQYNDAVIKYTKTKAIFAEM